MGCKTLKGYCLELRCSEKMKEKNVFCPQQFSMFTAGYALIRALFGQNYNSNVGMSAYGSVSCLFRNTRTSACVFFSHENAVVRVRECSVPISLCAVIQLQNVSWDVRLYVPRAGSQMRAYACPFGTSVMSLEWQASRLFLKRWQNVFW